MKAASRGFDELPVNESKSQGLCAPEFKCAEERYSVKSSGAF